MRTESSHSRSQPNLGQTQVLAVQSRGSQVAILGETPNVILPPNFLIGKYFEMKSTEVKDIAEHNELRATILGLIEEQIGSSDTI